MDNLISKLSARQRGIASDGDKEFCYKDSSSALRVLATQKKWNSSTLAWDYQDAQFKVLTVDNLIMTGSISYEDLTLTGLTASTVIYANVDKKLTSSAVSPTELGYLSGKNSVIDGSGTTDYLPYFSGTGRLANSPIRNNGTSVELVGTDLVMDSGTAATIYLRNGTLLSDNVEVIDLKVLNSTDLKGRVYFLANTGESDYTYLSISEKLDDYGGALLVGVQETVCGTFSPMNVTGWHKYADPADDDACVRISGQKGTSATTVAAAETLLSVCNLNDAVARFRGNGDLAITGALDAASIETSGGILANGALACYGMFEVFDDALIYGDIQADGANFTNVLVDSLNSFGTVTASDFETGYALQTDEGGFAVKLTNVTGSTVTAGQLVTLSSTAGSFVKAAANAYDCIGVAYGDIANNEDGWIVVSGRAQVLIDSSGSTAGNFLRTGSTSGSAKAEAVPTPGTSDTHFKEIGHCLQTVSGGNLAWAILHFN
jgi:hypothetical protein